MNRREFARLAASAPLFAVAPPGPAPSRNLLIDFRTEAGRAGWLPTHEIKRLAADADGLRIWAQAGDPYIAGPPVNVPVHQPLWLRIRLKTTLAGGWQIFYWPAKGNGPREEDSLRFSVAAGNWQEFRLLLPVFDASPVRFRIDPPGSRAHESVVAWLDVEPRLAMTEPEGGWPRPRLPQPAAHQPAIHSGELAVSLPEPPFGFRVQVADEWFAAGSDEPMMAYQTAPTAPLHWMKPGSSSTLERDIKRRQTNGRSPTVESTLRFTDGDGGNWTYACTFTPGKTVGSIVLTATLTVSQDRLVAHFPWLSLLVGAGTFGAAKHHALLAGVEYLEGDEPSSSDADNHGPGAKRIVPDAYKLTLPLMAVAHGGKWLAVAWDDADSAIAAAVFDSPNRRLAGGLPSHYLGLHFPGTAGASFRVPGDILPVEGQWLRAGKPVTLRVVLLGGRGETITEAVKAWLTYSGRAALPGKIPSPSPAQVRETLAAGWLDSGIRDSGNVRHALPGTFTPQPAADAAACAFWLAREVPSRAPALTAFGEAALAQVAPADRDITRVGHGSIGAAVSLAFGGTLESLRKRNAEARAALVRFSPDGSIPFVQRPGGLDFASTHWARHANGTAAPLLAGILETALLTGDRDLIRESLSVLRKLDELYGRGVPRGAQTWEVPLHTPDILASAYMIYAFTRGWELSGDPTLLQSAIYWAWTGVPFVYLRDPAGRKAPVGRYATIAVLGATVWIAPDWIGLPVQWCGLVYADALLDLAAHDPSGPWQTLANGIVASGAAQMFPVGSDSLRQGLLPDSYDLTTQLRNDPGINPATLLVPWARVAGRPLSSHLVLRPAHDGQLPCIAHTPGRLRLEEAAAQHLRFQVEGWPSEAYTVLITGLDAPPKSVTVNGKTASVTWHPDERLLLVPAAKRASVALTL